MKEFVEIASKYGATGLLAVWLFITNKRVEKLEQQLYDCLTQTYYDKRNSEQTTKPTQYFAVLPEKIRYEKTNKRNAKG
jgi:hypothetical protein